MAGSEAGPRAKTAVASHRTPGNPRSALPFPAASASLDIVPATARNPRQIQETIESRENRWLKRFRFALRDTPEEGAPIGVEGPRLVEEAFRSRLRVEALLVSSAGERHLSRLKPHLDTTVRLLRCSDRLFASASGTEAPQGIAALVHPRSFRWEDLLAGNPLVILLVGVQDPGNVGTAIRSAEAFGATGAVACRGTAHPLAPKALRASAGSAFRLPLIAGVELEQGLAMLRDAGLRIYAASLAGELSPQDTDLRKPAALLIGNEAAGLPTEIESAADARLRIPLAAGVESLNAAVAASVLLYEAARQRGKANRGIGR